MTSLGYHFLTRCGLLSGLHCARHFSEYLRECAGRRTTKLVKPSSGQTTTTDDDDHDDDGQMSTFNPCHHIELNTTYPNTILKVTISFTQTPTMPNYFRFFLVFLFLKNRTFPKTHMLFCIMYKFHNSYVFL